MALVRCLSVRLTNHTVCCRPIINSPTQQFRWYSRHRRMSLGFYFFWLLPIPVLACILAAMYRRKPHFLYFIFWTYLLFQLLRVSAEFICRLISYKAFFYSYW